MMVYPTFALSLSLCLCKGAAILNLRKLDLRRNYPENKPKECRSEFRDRLLQSYLAEMCLFCRASTRLSPLMSLLVEKLLLCVQDVQKLCHGDHSQYESWGEEVYTYVRCIALQLCRGFAL